MASPKLPNDSGDLSLDVEKIDPETASPADSGLGDDCAQSVARDANKENERGRPTSDSDNGEQATSQDGGSIERTESQAARLGKKKALVIMFAICV